MPSDLKSYFYGAAIGFVGTVGLCIALYPNIFKHYGYGISQFGAVHETVVPSFIGFGITVYFLIRIGLSLRAANLFLSMFFLVAAACLSGVAITSHPFNRFTYDLHWWFVGALILDILVTIAWEIRNGTLKALDYMLVATFVATVVVSVLPFVRDIPIFDQFILRELIIFISSFWFLARTTFTQIAPSSC